MGVLDALLDARAGTALEESFAEHLHPRDFKGQFARKLGGLRRLGDRAEIPGGGHVKRVSGGYMVHAAGAKDGVKATSAASAAHVATEVSLRSRHPDSVGGPQAFAGEKDYATRGAKRDIPAVRTPNIPGQGERPGSNPLNVSRGGTRRRKLTEAELADPKAIGQGSWTGQVAVAMRKLKAAPVADPKTGEYVNDTENIYRERLPDGSLGAYSPERTALHEQIVDLLLRHAGEHPGEARAVFVAGGPASGKSSAIKQGHVSDPADSVIVNPDVVRAMLPEYRRLVDAGDKEAASKVHEEASYVTKVVMNLALHRNHHVLVDGVGAGDPGKFAGKVLLAQRVGHLVEVNVVSIPTPEAVKRADARNRRSGRSVPLGYLRTAHAEVSERFVEDVRDLAGVTVRVFDNQDASVILAAERLAHEKKLRVLNEARYRAFVKKVRRKVDRG